MSHREPQGGQKLTSWKEIASYLEKSVRTVRRWEATEGLPVHRHRHQKGATVFALRREIDAWQDQRRAMAKAPQPAAGSAPAAGAEAPPERQPEHPGAVRRRWLPAAAAALAVIGLAAAWRLHDAAPSPSPPPVAEADRARVLVAAVDNRTEQLGTAAVLERALERQIVESGRLLLVPRRRVDETLRLMRLESGRPVAAGLALEVAERDGRIDAVVAGRIERTVDGTLLSVDVLAAAEGGRLLSLDEPVRAADGLLPGIDRLASRFGRELGQRGPELRADRSQPPRVTTGSRAAFQLYSQGDVLLAHDRPEAAAQLYRLALVEDPEFAAARIQLAWAEREAGADAGSYLAAAERAARSIAAVSNVEGHFIRGSRAHLEGDVREAWSAYGALLSADSDHYWGNQRALEVCRPNRPRADCLPLQVRVAELRSDDIRASYRAARDLVFEAADLARARSFAERGRALLDDRVVAEDPEMAVWLMLFEARRHWARGEVAAVLEQAAALERRMGRWPPSVRDLVARELGTMELALGRLDEAETWFRRISDPSSHHEMIAWYLFASGRKEELGRHLARGTGYSEPFTAVLLAMVGEQRRAAELIRELETEGLTDGLVRLARGASAFFAGRPDEAIRTLEAALSELKPTGHSVFFAGSDILAMAHRQRGDLLRAIQALEMTSRQRQRAIFSDAGLHWIKCQSRLAGFYLEAGRGADLRATDEEIGKRLRVADPAFPELAGLTERATALQG